MQGVLKAVRSPCLLGELALHIRFPLLGGLAFGLDIGFVNRGHTHRNPPDEAADADPGQPLDEQQGEQQDKQQNDQQQQSDPPVFPADLDSTNSASPSDMPAQPRDAPSLVADAGGDIVLECDDGGHVRAMSQVLALCSPYFKDVMAATSGAPMASPQYKVEGNQEAWQHLLCRLYPVFPRPAIDIHTASLMLPLAVKFNFPTVLAELSAFLAHQFPQNLSADPTSQCYVIQWLRMADELHLDDLRRCCLARIRDLALHHQANQALLAPTQDRPRTAAESSATAATAGVAGGRGEGGKDLHGSPEARTSALDTMAAHLFPQHPQVEGGYEAEGGHVELHEGVRGLSRHALEDLVASVAAACCEAVH